MEGIFSGVTVLDLTKVYSGPLATRMLADHGATVIKIEHPQYPDDARNFPPLRKGWSGYFEILNRNKKCISLDLRNDRDYAKFCSLYAKADVAVENLSPESKYRLRIDYDRMKHCNPNIIYASLSGYDDKHPFKYYDIIAQAQSGLMSLSGNGQNPVKIGPAVVDAFSGMTLAFAIAGALYHRKVTGKGQNIHVSMFAGSMNLLEENLISYSISGKNPIPAGNHDTAIAPFGIFKANDGKIVLACGSNQLWSVLVSFLKNHTAIREPLYTTNTDRLAHQGELIADIERVFTRFTVDELLEKLTPLGIPCAKVAEMSDVAENPWLFSSHALEHVSHPLLGECIVPGKAVRFGEESERSVSIAAQVGEHNKEYGV